MVTYKELGMAYLLWFFLGFFGVHQFYLGKTGRGVGYLLTCAWLGVGWVIDGFTLPAQVRAVNTQRSIMAGAYSQHGHAIPPHIR